MNGNFTIRDEIREYWSQRAETFDLQVGHEVFTERERDAWHALFLKHLGVGNGRKVLDMACGTGVISHLLFDLGFDVTGLDWSEEMLAKARTKSADRGSKIHFLTGDAESTHEKSGNYDAIVMRHLVWTLVDPQTAFNHWFDLLKPGGKLLIVDGDFVYQSVVGKLIRTLRDRMEKFSSSSLDEKKSPIMMETHKRILSQVYFRDGAKAKDIAKMLAEEKFCNIEIHTNLSAIHKAQSADMSYLEYLERSIQNRYAICAIKPDE